MSTTIYLFRHGDILNPNQLLYLQLPNPEFSLSDLGRQQVLSQAKRLQDKQIQAIYHSGLLRARQTAELADSILQTNFVTVDPRLMDNYSPVQGVTLAEFDQRWDGTLYHPDLLTRGGESMTDVKDRMLSSLTEIAARHLNQSVIAISHGDPIKIVWLDCDNLPLDREHLGSDRHPVPGVTYPVKGSVTVLTFANESIKKVDYWPPEMTSLAV